MDPKEIDRRVREAYDTGYLEGVLMAKEANGKALTNARLGTSAMGFAALVAASVLVYVSLT